MSLLDNFVEETYTQYQQESKRRKQQETMLLEAELQNRYREFREKLVELIGEDLVAELNLTYEFRGEKLVHVHFNDMNVRWELERGRYGNYALEARTDYGEIPFRKTDIKPEQLKTMIGVGLGEVRTKVIAKQQKVEREREERKIRDEKQAQENAIRAEQERVQAEEERRIHLEISAMLEQKRQETLESAWRWPEGKTITYYSIGWQTGQTWEEGQYNADYDGGYTTVDSLDGNGYIVVYPNYGSGLGRMVKLNLEIHRPIWTRFEADSIEVLPDHLKVNLDVVIEGITFGYSPLQRDPVYSYNPDRSYRETLQSNGLPMWWIQQLVDQA